MPHLGVPELLIIMVIIVLVFGVGKLPQIGKALGQGIREFREGTQGLGLTEEDASKASPGKSDEA
jgi:sec-independent protein translocase protein TatA